MRQFLRDYYSFFAPLATVVSIAAFVIAIWRLTVGDARDAGVFAIFAAGSGLYVLLGWRVRANDPEDPWEPR